MGEIFPKKDPYAEALEIRISELNPGDFNQDDLPEIEIEDGAMSDENDRNSNTWPTILLGEFRELKGWLSGTDGRGGKIGSLETQISDVAIEVRHINDHLSTLTNTQIKDRAHSDARDSAIENEIEKTEKRLSTQIYNVAEIGRGAHEKIDEHLKELEIAKKAEAKAEEKKEEKKERTVGQWLTIAGIIVAPFIGAGATLLILGG